MWAREDMENWGLLLGRMCVCHHPTFPEPGGPEEQLKADRRSPFNILLHF